VRYEIHFNPRTWNLRILDQGMTELVEKYVNLPNGGKKKMCFRETIRSPMDGTPVTAPVPLDGNGKALRPFDANCQPNNVRVYNVGMPYYRRPFAPLNLP
jgi:hypothetical protein